MECWRLRINEFLGWQKIGKMLSKLPLVLGDETWYSNKNESSKNISWKKKFPTMPIKVIGNGCKKKNRT